MDIKFLNKHFNFRNNYFVNDKGKIREVKLWIIMTV